MDLSKFKKIACDGKSTTLKHPEGHKVIIAHHALSPKMKAELKKISNNYADGGEVGSKEDEKKQEEIKEVSPWENFKNDVSAAKDMVASALPDKNVVTPNTTNPNAPGYVPPSIEAPVEQPVQAPVQSGPAPASLAPPVVSAPQPTESPTLAPQQAPATQVQPAVPGLQNSVANYQAGLNQEAKAIGALGKEEAAIHDEHAKAMADVQKQYQQNSDKIMGDYNAVMADYKAGHINPNHYMESMSSGQKVRTAIGLILGGIGSGLAGGDNPAMTFLNNQIARDVKSQEDNLGKKANLLSYNMQQLGNVKDATQMTLAMTKGLYAEKLEKAAALSKDPIAKAKAMQGAMKFKMDSAEIMQKVAASQTSQGLLNNPNASPLMRIQGLPKEMRDNALKEYGDYKKIESGVNEVRRIMGGFSKISASDRINPFSEDKIGQLTSSLVPVIKPIMGESLQEADIKRMLTPYIPSLLSNNPAAIEKSTNNLIKTIIAGAPGKTPILSELKIVPDLKGMVGADKNERLVNWAKANPKDPRSKQIMEKLGR